MEPEKNYAVKGICWCVEVCLERANKSAGGVVWLGGLGGTRKLYHFIISSKNLPNVIALALNIMILLRLLSA